MVIDFQFIGGIESESVPTASSDPATGSDLISQDYANKTYAHGVADVAAVKAITAALRTDGLPILVKSLNRWFYFHSSSTATGNDITVITPTSGSGRWLIVGVGGTTSFAIANNQSGSSVTGLLFDNTKIRSAEVHYQVYRAATSTVGQCGILFLVYNGTAWECVSSGQAGDAGVTFDVNTSTGQVTYTSDNMSGSYDTTNSVMKYYTAQMEI